MFVIEAIFKFDEESRIRRGDGHNMGLERMGRNFFIGTTVIEGNMSLFVILIYEPSSCVSLLMAWVHKVLTVSTEMNDMKSSLPSRVPDYRHYALLCLIIIINAVIALKCVMMFDEGFPQYNI